MSHYKKIIWVVNCVNRKTLETHRELSISNYSSNLNLRLINWISRISNPNSPLIDALSLYAGDNWTVVKNTIAKVEQIELWIVSAGYGLIRSDAEIESYDATFERKDDNYVGKDDKKRDNYESDQAWWLKVNEWKGPSSETERSFKSLFKNNPDTPILFSLSRKYFSAVSTDLESAIENFPQRNNLFLFATGKLPEPFKRFHIPVHARYKKKIGGNPLSVTTRTASALIKSSESHKFDFETVQQVIMNDYESLDPLVPHNRKPRSDEQILKMIEEMKKVNPRHSHSSLLRVYRDQGYACEQGRFRDLYNKSSESPSI